MIQISIDEAEAFDRLAILEVKRYFANTPELKKSFGERIEFLAGEINKEISYTKARQVYISDAYSKLYNANFDLFVLIDESKKRPMQASELDMANYSRFEAKQKLQEIFFKNTLSENKIGYDKVS